MLTGSDIRTLFLKFFEERGHTIVPSSSLVPSNDPTLMFVNAGMVQFKNTFLGVEKRNYTRATSSQKCVRAGGKHNDLENVGHTARHHTFFEMLGNFSFGDYFKSEAIPFAWEFLTKVVKLPADKLYVTVYHTDHEAYKIWHEKIGLPHSRIIKINTSDNFWSMGDEGPCGPCTEIFYDHGEHIAGGLPGTPEEDGDRFVEIWNVVFMESYMEGGKIVRKLKQTGVDTGMGLERMVAAVQGVNSNYDIDMFQTIIQQTANLAGIKYGVSEANDVSLRVIADHLRATCFLLTDGVMPSNEGRGYVLRRIMRRAMRHVNLIGVKEPFIYKLVPTLVNVMGEAYLELSRASEMVADVIKMEEERFIRTLEQGLKLLEKEVAIIREENSAANSSLDENAWERGEWQFNRLFSGEIAFKLYDTYGFPLDLTEDVLKNKGITVDTNGFNTAMAEQKDRSRAAGGDGTGQSKLAPIWFDIQDEVGSTDFLGYKNLITEAQLLAIVKGDIKVKKLTAGEKAILVFNQSPFYAESGGQAGDVGVITFGENTVKVINTKKIMDGVFQHYVEVTVGEVSVGEFGVLKVNTEDRGQTACNHSATHLMHYALREVLGEHVFQKGSQVSSEKLRFDFSHPKAVTADEITKIEAIVNQLIWNNSNVITRLMTQETAVEAGALALFGEKYGDEVRVVSMGSGENPPSVELCGGTHVGRTGDIGLFKIVAETAIASGVRRVEAVTGMTALNVLNTAERCLKEVAEMVKSAPSEVVQRVQTLQNDKKYLEKELKQAQKGGSNAGGGNLVEKAVQVGDIKFISAELEGIAPNILREMVDDLKNQLGSGVVILATTSGDKATLVAGVTGDLTTKYNAGKLVNIAAATLGGKGGGRADMAMAGGKTGDVVAALAAAKQSLLN